MSTKRKKTTGGKYSINDSYQYKESSFQRSSSSSEDDEETFSDPMLQPSLSKESNPTIVVAEPMQQTLELVSNESAKTPQELNVLNNKLVLDSLEKNVEKKVTNTTQTKQTLEDTHELTMIQINSDKMNIAYNKKECVERYRDWERLQVRRRYYIELFKGKKPLLVVTDNKGEKTLKNNYVESKLPLQQGEKNVIIKRNLNTELIKCMTGPFPIDSGDKAPLPLDWKLGNTYQNKFLKEKSAAGNVK